MGNKINKSLYFDSLDERAKIEPDKDFVRSDIYAMVKEQVEDTITLQNFLYSLSFNEKAIKYTGTLHLDRLLKDIREESKDEDINAKLNKTIAINAQLYYREQKFKQLVDNPETKQTLIEIQSSLSYDKMLLEQDFLFSEDIFAFSFVNDTRANIIAIDLMNKIIPQKKETGTTGLRSGMLVQDFHGVVNLLRFTQLNEKVH